MTPKLSDEQREALKQEGGKPVYVVDADTKAAYVLLSVDAYQKVRALVSGDDEFDPNEFMPLVHDALADDMDAPGMELYDNYDAHRPQP